MVLSFISEADVVLITVLLVSRKDKTKAVLPILSVADKNCLIQAVLEIH